MQAIEPRIDDTTQASAAAALWEAFLTFRDGGSEEAYREAAADYRAGPSVRAGELVDDRFRLLAPREGAGIASCWEAWDASTSDRCLIWVLHPHLLAEADVVDRFLSGGRDLGAQGICPVRVAEGVWNGFMYRASDRPERFLSESVGEMSEGEAVALVVELAQCLEGVHGSEVVHGALSPEVVGLDAHGACSVVGFQLWAVGGAASLYLAPEAAGPGFVPTRSADLFALGMTAAFVLGRKTLPFWVMRDPERYVRELQVGDNLTAWLVEALSWDPESRPESAAQLASILLEDEGVVQQLADRAVATGRPAIALQYLEKLADSDAVSLARARTLVELDRKEEANELLVERIGLFDDPAEPLALLREWSGDDTSGLLAALVDLSNEDLPNRPTYLMEIARLEASGPNAGAAWESALAEHQTRSQGSECLAALAQLAEAAGEEGAWRARSIELWPLSPPELQPELALKLGRSFKASEDPQNALLWLERALVGGVEDPELQAELVQIRSDRGDWGELRRLAERRVEQEKSAEALRRAARLARYAERDFEVADRLYRQLLEAEESDPEALRFVIDHGHDDAEVEQLLERLAPHRSLDHVDDVRHSSRLARLRFASGSDAFDIVEAVGPRAPALQVYAARWASDRGHDARAAALYGEVAQRNHGPEVIEARLWLGEAAFVEGNRLDARTHYESVLALDADNVPALWGLAKVAMGGQHPDHPWVAAYPSAFSPPEGLARLLAWLLDDGALATVAGEAFAERAGLEQAARVTDLWLERGAVDDGLFDRLVTLAPDAAEAIDKVRQLVRGPEDPDHRFPAAMAERWSGAVNGHRSIVRSLAPAVIQPLTDEEWETVGVASTLRAESEAGELVLTPEPARPLLVRDPGRTGQKGFEVVGTLQIGGSDHDDLYLPGLPQGRCQAIRAGTRVYLVGTPPVRVDGAQVTECVLSPGQSIEIDGRPLLFAELSGDQELVPVAVDELPDEPTAQIQLLEDDEEEGPFGLFFHDGIDLQMVPLHGEQVTFGPGESGLRQLHKDRESFAVCYRDDGWVIELPVSDHRPDDDGMLVTEVPLSIDDIIEVGGVSYQFRSVDDVSPPEPVRSQKRLLAELDLDSGEQVIPIRTDFFTIGRGRRNDLQLSADAKVSRHHCTILLEAGHYLIRDNNSSNGTLVNGEPVDDRVLEDGDLLEIGHTLATFKVKEEVQILEEVDPGEITLLDHPDSEVLTSPIKRLPRVSIRLGHEKVEVANRALAPVLTALDRDLGAGSGRAELQLTLDGAPRRFKKVFDEIEVDATGLPVMRVLFNVGRLPDPAQLPNLNTALLDLIERFVSRGADLVNQGVDEMLEEVAEVGHRAELRL